MPRLLPLSAAPNVSPDMLPAIRLIATDIDGTLTWQQRFTPVLLNALQDLAAMDIAVVLTTGRSAGWVQALSHYLPATAAIAENGGVLFFPMGQGRLLTPLANSEVSHPDPSHPDMLWHTPAVPDRIATHRQQLAVLFDQLQTQFPQLHPAADNAFRWTDWTFDILGLDAATLSAIATHCHQQGWDFTYSTVQGHLKPLGQTKATGLQHLLTQYFAHISPSQVLTVGDSPNDETMFDPTKFPHSVGVANLLHYTQTMQHLPSYITQAPEVEGFCELVQWIHHSRPSSKTG